MIKNEINLQLDVIIFKDDKHFIAYAPALDFTAYGNNEKEAITSFDISIRLMIEEVIENGNLEEMLLMYGWQLIQKPVPIYTPPPINQYRLL